MNVYISLPYALRFRRDAASMYYVEFPRNELISISLNHIDYFRI